MPTIEETLEALTRYMSRTSLEVREGLGVALLRAAGGLVDLERRYRPTPGETAIPYRELYEPLRSWGLALLEGSNLTDQEDAARSQAAVLEDGEEHFAFSFEVICAALVALHALSRGGVALPDHVVEGLWEEAEDDGLLAYKLGWEEPLEWPEGLLAWRASA
jgi:hypothetical protein